MSSKKSTKNLPKKIDGKAIAKQGFKRSLGLLILFLTVTATSCMSLFS